MEIKLPREVDLRSLDYVVECNDNLNCPICRDPFINPQTLDECGHSFCLSCIQQAWASSTYPNTSYKSRNCPTCRTPARLNKSSSRNQILNNILDDLLVNCPYHSDGCLAEVKRAEVQDHVNMYCGYEEVCCPETSCNSTIRRKDVARGCLHYLVSCRACCLELSLADLDEHLQASCPLIESICGNCATEIMSLKTEHHIRSACPKEMVNCPGHLLGCIKQHYRDAAIDHAATCPFALLAPVFDAQRKRLDEQEHAQREMNRRLALYENGFNMMQRMLNPGVPSNNRLGTHESLDPLDARPYSTPPVQPTSSDLQTNEPFPMLSPFPSVETFAPFSHSPASHPLATLTPTFSEQSPYTSPFHHLMSMNENLRDEMTRISSAVQALDGRLSMENLNENLRTRDEISFLGAQLAGLSRQVHWLTSVQLQKQQPPSSPVAESSTSASNVSEIATATEAAVNVVNAATNLIRGTARGLNMRRRSSEEGRTKL